MALSLLILPFSWVLAWLAASFLHESCHYLAVRCCGGRIVNIRAGAGGAVMEADGLRPVQTIICALAGPVGALAALFFVQKWPAFGLCALVQSCCNLLPMKGLDGGNALRCAAELLTPSWAEKVCSAVNFACGALLILLALWTALGLRLGVIPVVAAACLLFRHKTEKFLAFRSF